MDMMLPSPFLKKYKGRKRLVADDFFVYVILRHYLLHFNTTMPCPSILFN